MTHASALSASSAVRSRPHNVTGLSVMDRVIPWVWCCRGGAAIYLGVWLHGWFSQKLPLPGLRECRDTQQKQGQQL